MRKLTAIATTIALPFPAIANADGYYGHMGSDGFGYGFLGMGMMVFIWALIFFAIFLAVKWLWGQNQTQNGNTAALDALNQRLGRGEIDIKEFEAIRKTLQS